MTLTFDDVEKGGLVVEAARLGRDEADVHARVGGAHLGQHQLAQVLGAGVAAQGDVPRLEGWRASAFFVSG